MHNMVDRSMHLGLRHYTDSFNFHILKSVDNYQLFIVNYNSHHARR